MDVFIWPLGQDQRSLLSRFVILKVEKAAAIQTVGFAHGIPLKACYTN